MNLARALVCEFLGSSFLLASVVGSGILAHRLDMGNQTLAILCVAFACAAVLSACIFALGRISAHFNPIVSLVLALKGELPFSRLLPYWSVQILGAIFGVMISNLMFELAPLHLATTVRSGAGQWLGEFVASFGLLAIILGTARSNTQALPIAVPFYVAGAIFFTSSTCFANPAVTIGRIFSDSFCGIDAASAPAFIAFQIMGALAAHQLFAWLLAPEREGGKTEKELSELLRKKEELSKVKEARALTPSSRR